MLHQGILICILLSLHVCSGFIDLSDTDYCKLCDEKKSHTACQYKSKKQPGACELKPLPLADKVALLRKHNELRAKVARGEEGSQPKAANMLRMHWDFELEAVAARWALQCKDQHDKCRDSTRFSVGQNIAWRTAWDLEKNVQNWYDEVNSFDAAGVDSYQFSSKTGHYTQLVWANTYLVGCAKTDRGSAPGLRFTLICNYGPSGNYLGQPIYKKGEPASACPSGAKPDSKYPGLCATSKEDFEDILLHKSIRLKAPATAAPMPLTVLLAFAMIFTKCWDLLLAFTAT